VVNRLQFISVLTPRQSAGILAIISVLVFPKNERLRRVAFLIEEEAAHPGYPNIHYVYGKFQPKAAM
jgi:hypothetical protein